MIISNKSIYYRLWQEGKLGNRIRMWNTIDDLLKDSYFGNVNVRHAIPASIYSLWNIPKQNILKTLIDHCAKNNLNLSDFRFNEPTPDNHLVLQGEICECPTFKMFYCTDRVLMREAMRKGIEASEAASRLILKQYCDPDSYDSINYLLNKYPGHTIEFGIYSRYLGFIPRRNTIIWEVRNY